MADIARIKIDDVWTSEGKDFQNRVIALVKRQVHVGFFGDRHYIKEKNGKVDFVKVAARHEFGIHNRNGELTLFPNPRMDMASSLIEENPKLAEMGADYLEGKAPLMTVLNDVGKLARDIMRSVFKREPTFHNSEDSEYRKELDKGFRKNIEYRIVEK